MAYGTPTDPVAGTVITVAYAVANLLDPIRQLRANTGGADPPAANRVAVSTGVGGPTTWQQVPTDAILDAAVTDVKMATQKVSRAGDTMTAPLNFTDSNRRIVAATGAISLQNLAAGGRSLVSGAVVAFAQNLFWDGANWNRIDTAQAAYLLVVESGNLVKYVATSGANPVSFASGPHKLWDADNDGPASGLAAQTADDADKVDGQHGAFYQARANHTGTQLAATLSDLATAVLARSTHTGTQAPATISPQGAGSTLDADNLDGATWHAGLTAENTVGATPTTSYADISSATVTLNRAGAWLILATVTISGSNAEVETQIVVNGVGQTPTAVGHGIGGSLAVCTSTFAIVSASNGHVAKLQFREGASGVGNQLRKARIAAHWLAP